MRDNFERADEDQQGDGEDQQGDNHLVQSKSCPKILYWVTNLEITADGKVHSSKDRSVGPLSLFSTFSNYRDF